MLHDPDAVADATGLLDDLERDLERDPERVSGWTPDETVEQVRRRLSLVLESSRLGIWDWNMQSGAVVVNQRWADLLGYSLADLEPISIDTWVRLAHPGDLARSDELIAAHDRGETEFYELDCRMRHRDGHWIWVRDRGRIVERTADGQALRMTGTHEDITELKTAAQRLAASESRFRTLVGATTSGLVVQDAAGAIVQCNPAAERLLGLRADEMIGRVSVDPRWRTVHEDGSPFPGHEHPSMVTLATGQPLTGVVIGVHKPDDTLTWLSVSTVPFELPDAPGEPAVAVTFTDITALKATEQRLAQSQRRFSQMFAEHTAVMLLTDPMTGQIVDANNAAQRYYGYPPDVLRSMRMSQINALDADSLIRHEELAVVGAPDAFVFPQRRADGSVRTVEVHSAPIIDGDRVLLFSIVRDITEDVAARAALTASEERFRVLAESIGDVVVVTDASGAVTWVSPSVSRVLGLDPGALIGTSMVALMHPEDAHGPQSHLDGDTAGAALGREYACRARYRHADGGYRVMDGRITFRFAADGSLLGGQEVLRDVDAEARAQEELRRSRLVLEEAYDETAQVRATLQTSLDASVDAFAVYDVERAPEDRDEVVGLRLVLMNRAGASPLGVEPEDIAGQDIRTFYPAATSTGLWPAVQRVARTGVPVFFRNEDPATGTIWDNRVTPVGEDRVVNVWRDVTPQARAERELAKSEERFRIAMTYAPVPMMLATGDGRLSEVNDALSDMLGYPRHELLDMALADLAHPDDVSLTAMPTAMAFGDGPARAARELRLLTRTGELRWGQLSLSVIRGDRDQPDRVIAQILDVTEVRAAQEELAHQALHDALTGLANRARFQHELGVAHTRAARSGHPLVVLFCDLDRFKQINDTHGHPVGDAVLVEVADRLRSAVRASDLVARLGGDEFVVIAEGLEVPDGATGLAERIRQDVGRPIVLDGIEIAPATSIGLAISEPGDDPDAVVRHADAALYQAKLAGRNQWRLHPGP